jgi:hypothetical protein
MALTPLFCGSQAETLLLVLSVFGHVPVNTGYPHSMPLRMPCIRVQHRARTLWPFCECAPRRACRYFALTSAAGAVMLVTLPLLSLASSTSTQAALWTALACSITNWLAVGPVCNEILLERCVTRFSLILAPLETALPEPDSVFPLTNSKPCVVVQYAPGHS